LDLIKHPTLVFIKTLPLNFSCRSHVNEHAKPGMGGSLEVDQSSCYLSIAMEQSCKVYGPLVGGGEFAYCTVFTEVREFAYCVYGGAHHNLSH
jgi:hypothetical protein